MKDPADRLKTIRRIVELFSAQAETRDASVSDFVRLVGLEREFREDEVPRAIEVTWVPPSGKGKRR